MSGIWCRTGFVPKLVFARLRRERGGVSKLLMLTAFIAVMASMLSLNRELTEGPLRYLKSVQVDYWITQGGADSLGSNSFVQPSVLKQLQKRHYDADGLFVYFTKAGDHVITLQSYQPGGILSPRMVQGAQPRNSHETVLDHKLASELGVSVGQKIRLAGRWFTIVGLSNRSNGLIREVAFVNHDAMAGIIGHPVYQALAVNLRPGQFWPSPDPLPRQYTVASQHQFINSNRQIEVETVTPFFDLIILIAVAGFSGMLLLSFKREVDMRRHELATLKAIGMRNRGLWGVEVLMALVLCLGATLLAVPAAVGIVAIANNGVPGISASINTQSILAGAVAAFVMCLLALVLPLGQIKRMRPTEVLATY
jgi:ABC-type antimicrobial peptide transport system permease subunit